jgi:hypothetical protein
MTPLSLFYIQMGIDALMCGLIVFFLWRVGKITAGPGNGLDRQELQRLITESQQSAQQFLDALAEGRKALHEIAYTLDEKEARLQNACRRAEEVVARVERKTDAGDASSFVDREQVLRMANDGAPIPDIVRKTGLTEGEVHLVIDLARSRDKKR